MRTVRSPAQAAVFVPAHGTILNSFGVQEQIREFGYNWKDQNLKSLDYPMIDFSNTFSQAMHKKKQGDYISRLPNSCIKIKIMVLWIKKSSIAWDELFLSFLIIQRVGRMNYPLTISSGTLYVDRIWRRQ